MSELATILTVHAHPDDEASKGAATIAKYVDRGARAILVCATGGEEGDLQNPSLREPGQPFAGLEPSEERELVASMRRGELEASAKVIGFDEVVLLGYRDSGMADSEPNNHPQCFWQADLDEAAGRLVEVIRRTKPQVVITYNDDQKTYPHPDHIRVHDISVLAFERAGDAQWYPEAGTPYTPAKLYYTTWSKRRLIAIHEGLLTHRGESPFDEAWLGRPDDDHRVTTMVNVGDFMWARTGALQAHASQVDPAAAFWFGLSDDELATVYPWEDWILAVNRVGEVPGHNGEDDMFAGLEVEFRPRNERPTPSFVDLGAQHDHEKA